MIKLKLATIAAKAGSWVSDFLMVAGAGGVSYGAWLVYTPAGFIVGGLFALAAGVVLARGGK